MANFGYISVAQELAAIETKINTIDDVVDDIRATDVPALSTLIGTVDDVVDDIRAVDVPALAAEHEAIDGKIDTVDGLVDGMVALMPASTIKAAADFNMHAQYLSDDIIHSNDAEVEELSSTYTKHKEIACPLTGKLRIYYEGRAENVAGGAYGAVYKNGVLYGTPNLFDSETYQQYTEDMDFVYGDLIQLYLHGNNTYKSIARYFRVCGVLINDFVNTL